MASDASDADITKAAAAELRRIQEKSPKRQERDERTLVVAKWGPITALDARARAAKDENNRREAQEEENCRIRKKEVRIEVGFLRCWLRAVRGMVRASLEDLTFAGEALAVIWPTTEDRQVQLRDDGWMGRRYACLRQLRQIQSRSDSWVGRRYKSLRRTLLGRGPSDNRPPLRWPTEFDLSIVRAAVEDVVDKAE
ncbi:hypothetical protein E4U37_008324, partial [Claviceps purpurea]